MSKESPYTLADEALDAFWCVIARHYPQGNVGDRCTNRTKALKRAASAAVREWLSEVISADHRFYSVCPLPRAEDVEPGYQFKLRYNHCRQARFIPARTTGTIKAVIITARLDLPPSRFTERQREFRWDAVQDFLQQTRSPFDPE